MGTLIWTDDFESYTVNNPISSPWTVTVGNPFISGTVAHGGSKSVAGGASGNTSGCRRPLGSSPSQWYADFWMYTFNTGATGAGIGVGFSSAILSAPTNNPTVSVDGTGAGRCTGPAGVTFFTFSVSLNAWHHYIFEVLSAAAGTAKLTVDGTVAGTYSGDTRGGGTDSFVAYAYVNGVTIGPSPAAECYVDDYSVYSGVFTAGVQQARAMVLA